MESTHHAKISIYIATFAIVVAAIFSLWGNIETRSGNELTSLLINEVIAEIKSNRITSSGEISELNQAVNELLSETKKNETLRSNEVMELKRLVSEYQALSKLHVGEAEKMDATQAEYFSKMILILGRIERSLGGN